LIEALVRTLVVVGLAEELGIPLDKLAVENSVVMAADNLVED